MYFQGLPGTRISSALGFENDHRQLEVGWITRNTVKEHRGEPLLKDDGDLLDQVLDQVLHQVHDQVADHLPLVLTSEAEPTN